MLSALCWVLSRFSHAKWRLFSDVALQNSGNAAVIPKHIYMGGDPAFLIHRKKRLHVGISAVWQWRYEHICGNCFTDIRVDDLCGISRPVYLFFRTFMQNQWYVIMPLLFRKIKYFSKTRSRKESVILRFSCDEFWKNTDVTGTIRGCFIDVTDDTVRKNADRYRDGYQINQKMAMQEHSTLHGHFVFARWKIFSWDFLSS